MRQKYFQVFISYKFIDICNILFLSSSGNLRPLLGVFSSLKQSVLPRLAWPLLCRHQEPRVDLSSFSISPSCASQDGFKRLVGNVVHLLLGHHHPPRALLQVEVADPLLDQAGQLLSDFARHVIRLLASCPRNCQRATDGVRGDPAYVECYALQIRATPASPSLVAPPPSTTPNPTPRQLPFLVLNPRRNRTHPPTVAELVCLRRNTCFTTTTPNIYHTCVIYTYYTNTNHLLFKIIFITPQCAVFLFHHLVVASLFFGWER